MGLHNLLLPLQGGMRIDRIIALATELDCGVFVGVPRSELEACARGGADAVDSSSFLRAQHHNVGKRHEYAEALSMSAWERGNPVRETHSPRLARVTKAQKNAMKRSHSRLDLM